MDERENKISMAFKEIENGMSKKRTSKKFGVPRSTLQFRMGPKFKKPGYGPGTYLTKEEENMIVKWTITCQNRGFPRRIDGIQKSVQNFVKETGRQTPFPNGLPGKGWYRAFCKRHPELCLRTSEAVTQGSACVRESDIRKWFDVIEQEIKNLGHEDILLDSSRIFDGDESNFLLYPKNKKVVAVRGTKNTYEVDQAAAKASLIVMCTFGASDVLTPPMVIYPYKRKPPKEISKTVPEKWGVGYSDNGWMKASIFYEYIGNVFNRFLVENKVQKPIILFVDGHKTHLTLQVNKLCNDLGIILIALYPNSTRILQPADVAAFKPLKNGWQKGILEWRREHPNLQFTKENFAPLLFKVIEKYMNKNIIRNGFRATGLYPWNPNAIDYSKCLSNYREELNSTKLMNFQTFKSIIGERTLQYLETQQLEESDPEMRNLRKIFEFFTNNTGQGYVDINDMPIDIILTDECLEENQHSITCETSDGKGESSWHPELQDNQGIGSSDVHDCNQTTVHGSQHEDNITDDEVNAALQEFDEKMECPTNKGIAAVTPSTSAPIEDVTSSPISQILIWPESPKRKNVRNTEKMPYVISSEAWRLLAEEKEKNKRTQEEAKENRKRIRLEKKTLVMNKAASKKKIKPSAKNKIDETKILNREETSIKVNGRKPKIIILKEDILTANKENLQENIKKNDPEPEITIFQDEIPNATNDPLHENQFNNSPPKNFLNKGICYACANNITSNKMGRNCSKCTRTFHSNCVEKKSFFANIFTCSRCMK